MPVILFVLGLVIALVSIIYAALNMLNSNFDNISKNFTKAIIGVALGGTIATIGMYTGVWEIIQKILEISH